MQTSWNAKWSKACGLFIALIVLVPVQTAWSAGGCCLTTYLSDSVLVSAMTSAGYSNVQKQKATCDEIIISGTMAVMTVTFDYKIINSADLEMTMTQSMNGTVLNTIKDTTPSICAGVTGRSVQKSKAIKILSASPDPFTRSVQLGFENPFNKASVAVYDIRGAKVADIKDVPGNRFTWVPAGIDNGRYLIVVTTGKSIFAKQVTYLNK